jgi:hypothetical protein
MKKNIKTFNHVTQRVTVSSEWGCLFINLHKCCQGTVFISGLWNTMKPFSILHSMTFLTMLLPINLMDLTTLDQYNASSVIYRNF